MKRIFIAVCVCALSLSAQAQEQDYMTYHSCDFTEGIPSDYTTHDLDGQTLHYTMVQAGIKQGEAWARKKESGKNNYYAMSACRYKEVDGIAPGPADDWLITPQIWIRGREAKISWQGMSVKNLLKVGAGYEVLLSTTGNNPEDFTTTLFSIDEETINTWTSHEIDLAAYEGQHIYIAFHNNSAQGEILGIDDILVTGHRGVCNFEVTTGSHIYATNNLDVSVAITSYHDTPITHMTLCYNYGNNTVTETIDNLSIEKYETYNYTFPTPIAVEYSDTVRYTVGAIVQDIPQDEIDCETVAFAFKTTRRTVVEEATGMWCTYCPEGIEAMEILEHKYPDEFIGLALHMDDLISQGSYCSELGFPEGLPTAWVNRSQYVINIMTSVERNNREELVPDNGGLETVFLAQNNIVAATDIAISHIDTYNNAINVTAVVRPAIDMENVNYNIAFVIVEDNVWQEGYYQTNGYSNHEIYLKDWYERPKSVTEDFAFNHVVRAIYDDYQGIAGIIPSQLSAGEEYTSTHTFELPSHILNLDNVKVVAMIINLDNGEIVNACKSQSLTALPATTTSAHNYCYASDNTIHVVTPQPSAHIAIYDTTGRLVATQSTQQSHTAWTVQQGIYIVAITHNDTTTTHKVVVR